MTRTKRVSNVPKRKGKRVKSKRMSKRMTKRRNSTKRMRRTFIKKSRGRSRRSLRRMRGGMDYSSFYSESAKETVFAVEEPELSELFESHFGKDNETRKKTLLKIFSKQPKPLDAVNVEVYVPLYLLSPDGSVDRTKYHDYQRSHSNPEPKPFLAHIGHGELIAKKITDMGKDPMTREDDIEKMEQLLNDLKFLEKKTGLSTDKMTMISRNIYYLTWKINYYNGEHATHTRLAKNNYEHKFGL